MLMLRSGRGVPGCSNFVPKRREKSTPHNLMKVLAGYYLYNSVYIFNIQYTLWQSNIAMENPPFIDNVLPNHPLLGDFPLPRLIAGIGIYIYIHIHLHMYVGTSLRVCNYTDT